MDDFLKEGLSNFDEEGKETRGGKMLWAARFRGKASLQGRNKWLECGSYMKTYHSSTSGNISARVSSEPGLGGAKDGPLLGPKPCHCSHRREGEVAQVYVLHDPGRPPFSPCDRGWARSIGPRAPAFPIDVGRLDRAHTGCLQSLVDGLPLGFVLYFLRAVGGIFARRKRRPVRHFGPK